MTLPLFFTPVMSSMMSCALYVSIAQAEQVRAILNAIIPELHVHYFSVV